MAENADAMGGTEAVTECGIQGDETSANDRYVMRIDHRRCGSQVDHEQLTVRTFITVQENLGIFTHSTRRFLVVCSYQPDTLTVRASFSVPGKASAIAADALSDGDAAASDRSGRQRKFRMVGKDALVLKEATAQTDDAALTAEASADGSGFRTARRQAENSVYPVEEQNAEEERNTSKMSKYARLVTDATDSGRSGGNGGRTTSELTVCDYRF